MAPNRNNVVSVGLLRARHGEANRASRTSRWSNALTDVVTSARAQTVTVGGFLCSRGELFTVPSVCHMATETSKAP